MKLTRTAIALIGLLLFLSNASAQSFDEWFEEGVMRLDMIFTGSSSEGTYALSAVRREPYYSGSRENLLDPFDYGDHKLVIRDQKTGKEIYSQTYCSLYREWQTTSEAERVTRAFNHVVRFPFPRDPVRVELYDRNEAGIFDLTWAEELDPDAVYADPGNPLVFKTVDLEINGPPEKKVDLLFVAEGYTGKEMDKFLEDVKRSVEYIFSEEPFKSYRDAFNIRAVQSVSQETGPDIPGRDIWHNTIMNASFYTFGIERYMTTLDYVSVCDVASSSHYDQIYILVNTPKYGGGGMYNMYAISAADNERSQAVVVHEFGHAFGGLADEYYTSKVAYNDFFNLEAEPWNPNLTTLVNFESKWPDIISEGTPIPTPPEDPYLDKVGVFEGGGYVAKGVYRPMVDCLMHSNDASFCPVCQRAIIQMIQRYTGQ
ncbi:MAG: M64 family metallopeptidase [Bacteroidales bacterium]